MTLRRLIKQNSNDNYILEDRRKSSLYPAFSVNSETDNKRLQTLVTTLGTLPRGRKQLTLCRSNSLVDYTDSPRATIVLEKQDNETFGFEIQRVTGFVCCSLTMCVTSSVAPVYNKCALCAIFRLETINGTTFKRIALEAKLQFLQQTLREKWMEFRKLLLQEQHLAQGNLNECNPQDTLDSLSSLTLSVGAGSATFSPALRVKHRFSSDSSCKSQLSVMTDDSDDQHYVFEDLATSPCRRASVDDECFLPRDSNAMGVKASVTRTSSISLASSNSGSGSPSWDMPGNAGLFGTLPRKMNRGSVKKRLLKFIPGLNHSVEEEETL
ncbi:UNVERIFIED_CONTAM: hypothetical protein FKN15_052012 [Acipenser sinensis]